MKPATTQTFHLEIPRQLGGELMLPGGLGRMRRMGSMDDVERPAPQWKLQRMRVVTCLSRLRLAKDGSARRAGPGQKSETNLRPLNAAKLEPKSGWALGVPVSRSEAMVAGTVGALGKQGEGSTNGQGRERLFGVLPADASLRHARMGSVVNAFPPRRRKVQVGGEAS